MTSTTRLIACNLISNLTITISNRYFDRFTPFRARFTSFVKRVTTFNRHLLSSTRLISRPSKRSRRTLNFSRSGQLLLSQPMFKIYVRGAFQMLITSHVITRSRARLVTAFNSSHTKQRNKLTITIHIVTNSTIHHIIVASPYLTSSIKCISSTLTALQRRTRNNTKPIGSFGRNIQVINGYRNNPDNNLIRQRRFTTTLMVIVNRRQTTSTERHNITSRRMSKRAIRRIRRVTRNITIRVRQHIINIRTSTILIRMTMKQRLPRP